MQFTYCLPVDFLEGYLVDLNRFTCKNRYTYLELFLIDS